jgi:hypothetical protein
MATVPIEFYRDAGTATTIAEYHFGLVDYVDATEQIGRGRDRTAYVDHNQVTVYKVGCDSANREEYRVLTQYADADGDWRAPPVELYDIVVEGEHGPISCTIIAMPYLPEDGSVEHDGLIIPAAGDMNPANVHAHGGHLWLIDAGGM